MARGVPITQEKIVARKRKRRFYLALSVVFCLVIIISGLSLISSLDFFQVKDIEISGGEKEVPLAETIVEKSLTGQSLWFFPHSDIFFVSAKNIAKNISEAFPSVSSVSVSKKYFGTIYVTLEDKTPAALWCLDTSCVSLDQNGYAFEKADSASSSLVIFENGAAPTVGAAPIPADEFIPLLIFVNNLPQRGIYASSVMLNSDNTDDIYVGTSTAIVVDPTKDLSASLGNLDRVLDNSSSGISAENITSLQYLDLRFPDKIFYK